MTTTNTCLIAPATVVEVDVGTMIGVLVKVGARVGEAGTTVFVAVDKTIVGVEVGSAVAAPTV